MKLTLSYDDQMLAQNTKTDLAPFCDEVVRRYDKVIDAMHLHIKYGVVVAKGFTKQGKMVQQAIGFTSIQTETPEKVADRLCSKLRLKLEVGFDPWALTKLNPPNREVISV